MKKILIMFLISVMGVHAAEPDGEKKRSNRASHRAALILEDTDSVFIDIYPGMALHGKGLHRLSLSTKDSLLRSLRDGDPNVFLLDTKAMRTFVEALADGGVLDGASHYDPSLKIMREPFFPKGYAISISNFAASWVMELDLGLDLDTVKTLKTLRKGLSGKAGKAMDELLGKLSDHLKTREAESKP